MLCHSHNQQPVFSYGIICANMGLFHEIQKTVETIGKQFTTSTKPGSRGKYEGA